MHRFIPSGQAPIFFTFAYVMLFSIGFMFGGNYEFALYTIVMLAALVCVVGILRHVNIPDALLWALSIMGMLHMMGGGVHVHGDRLYGYLLIDIYTGNAPGFVIFKYDQLVHMLGYAVIAIVALFLLRRSAPQLHTLARLILSVLAAIAIGSLSELAEFAAVLLLPSTGVGDYFNTMLDLSFNTFGAAAGVVLYESWMSLKKRSE